MVARITWNPKQGHPVDTQYGSWAKLTDLAVLTMFLRHPTRVVRRPLSPPPVAGVGLRLPGPVVGVPQQRPGWVREEVPPWVTWRARSRRRWYQS